MKKTLVFSALIVLITACKPRGQLADESEPDTRQEGDASSATDVKPVPVVIVKSDAPVTETSAPKPDEPPVLEYRFADTLKTDCSIVTQIQKEQNRFQVFHNEQGSIVAKGSFERSPACLISGFVKVPAGWYAELDIEKITVPVTVKIDTTDEFSFTLTLQTIDAFSFLNRYRFQTLGLKDTTMEASLEPNKMKGMDIPCPKEAQELPFSANFQTFLRSSPNSTLDEAEGFMNFIPPFIFRLARCA
jgi:hypothetical protein